MKQLIIIALAFTVLACKKETTQPSTPTYKPDIKVYIDVDKPYLGGGYTMYQGTQTFVSIGVPFTMKQGTSLTYIGRAKDNTELTLKLYDSKKNLLATVKDYQAALYYNY